MIIDERTYTIQPTRVDDYVKLYQQMGKNIQVEILGGLMGFYTVEIGDVNQLVHMWSYASLADREQRRAKLWGHPQWLNYVDALRQTGWLVHQSNRILVQKIGPI